MHYIYDPLCGWCYAVSPLVQAAREVMTVVAHSGGMMTGTLRRQISIEWRDYVRPNDQQIAKVTGQTFGRGYLSGLLEDHTAWLDSEPPTAAVLAAEQMEHRGLDMLSRLYIAHYVEGLRVADTSMLILLAVELGLDERVFQKTLEAKRTQTARHFAESRSLLEKVGGRGFPTFLIENENGLRKLNHIPFLGNPLGLTEALQMMSAPTSEALDSNKAGCTQNGCSF